jgi:hypothetical protein
MFPQVKKDRKKEKLLQAEHEKFYESSGKSIDFYSKDEEQISSNAAISENVTPEAKQIVRCSLKSHEKFPLPSGNRKPVSRNRYPSTQSLQT